MSSGKTFPQVSFIGFLDPGKLIGYTDNQRYYRLNSTDLDCLAKEIAVRLSENQATVASRRGRRINGPASTAGSRRSSTRSSLGLAASTSTWLAPWWPLLTNG